VTLSNVQLTVFETECFHWKISIVHFQALMFLVCTQLCLIAKTQTIQKGFMCWDGRSGLHLLDDLKILNAGIDVEIEFEKQFRRS
jgi:hypothetical protein